METVDMVRMANQISEFFKSYEADYARKEIAAHINSFWDPRMRRKFFQHVEAGGAGLNTSVLAAVELIRRPKD
jgi:formate dehydrogenase subunit delta